MKVSCSFETNGCLKIDWNVTTCRICENIASENFAIASPINTTVKIFTIWLNKETKYLPRHIGEKFPNLRVVSLRGCGLTVVRNHYFQDMQNLQYLTLTENRISAIDNGAFKDLVNLTELDLRYNLLETLDENIFATMKNLYELWLGFNKIKFLSFATFAVPFANLASVDMNGNVCISAWYAKGFLRSFDLLESDLNESCSFNQTTTSTLSAITE